MTSFGPSERSPPERSLLESPDLWAHLGRLRPRWAIHVEAAFLRDHGKTEERRWRATLRSRGGGEYVPLVIEGGSLTETLLRAAVAAEARDEGRMPGRAAGEGEPGRRG